VRLSVHVQRVVLHGVGDVSRESLETAIAVALQDRLAAGPPRPPAREPSVDCQVGRAVAPAVLAETGTDRAGVMR
jgi:hypothetical protein